MMTRLRSFTPGAMVVAAAVVLMPVVASAASVSPNAIAVAQYNFNNTLASSIAGAPSLVAVDPLGLNTFTADSVFGQTKSVYAVNGNASPTNQQAGLTLNTTGLLTSPSNYSVDMVFDFTDRNNAWRRILDVQNRQSDAGFYVDPSNNLDVYPVSGSATAWTNNAYHDVTLTDANGVVTAYLDGVLQFTLNTTVLNLNADPTSNPDQLLGLFLDNVVGGGQGEFSDAKIASLTLYNGVLGAGSITPPTPPAPTPVPYSTGANRPCVTGSLQSYVDLGDAGCTIGLATFYNFGATGTYSPSDPNGKSGLGDAQNVDVLDNITVTPDADGTAGFVYTSDSLFDLQSGYAQYGINYYVDPPIDIVGFHLRDAPFVNSSVSADICVGNTFAVNCPAGTAGNEYQAFIDDTHPSDDALFPQGTTFNDVHLLTTLDARDGPASIEGFGQSSDVAALPEPGSLALVAIGGLALFGKRRRRGRASA